MTATITIQDRITTAYELLAERPGEFIQLTEIADLTGLSVAEMTPVMIRMYQDQRINLVPQADQQILTRRQRDEALRIDAAGTVKHLISIGG